MTPSRGCGVIAIGFAALWLVCSVIGANQAQPFEPKPELLSIAPVFLVIAIIAGALCAIFKLTGPWKWGS